MRKAHLLLITCLIFIGQAYNAKAQDNQPKDNPPLTVTATKSGDDVVISWEATSKSATYDVVRAKTNATGTEIISEETLATGISETEFIDNTWQNENVGGYYKWGVKYSEAKGNRQEIIIGDGTNTTPCYPIYGQYPYSLSQQIYTKDKIGMSGTISSIGFNIYAAATSNTTRSVIIYMKSISDAFFTGYTSWAPVGESDIVYQGSINVGSTGWVTINLDKTFSYTNDKNLLVCVNDCTGLQSQNCRFYCTSSTGYSVIYKGNTSAYNINNPGSGVSGSVASKFPNIKLVIGGSVQQTYWSNVIHNKWYSVSIKDGIQNGTISADESVAYVGQTVTITATPNEIYHLERLYYYPNDDVYSTTEIDITTRQFQMPEKDITVAAEFERDDDKFTISIKSGIENGSISANASYAQVGQIVTITATPDDNYRLGNLYYYPDDDISNHTDIDMTTMQFSMPEKDITVAAEFEKDLVKYNIYVKDIMDGPITGATVTLSNSTSSYNSTSNDQGWAILNVPSSSYNYSVSKEGYITASGTCEAQTFDVVLSENHEAPSNLYISATGWATWTPPYSGGKAVTGYKLRTEDYWGVIENIDITTPYHQFDISKYPQGSVYNVYVAAVYTGNVESIYNNAENGWGYMPCTLYNAVNDYLAEFSDGKVYLSWSEPDPKDKHELLGYMVWRGDELLTQTILDKNVNSFVDSSDEAIGSAKYCVKAVYDDSTDPYNGYYCMSCDNSMIPDETYHWSATQQPNSMTVIAVIEIDNVVQSTSALEVGAFYGDECRGRKRATYSAEAGKYIANFKVYGNSDEKIKFRLYDHGINEELKYKCTSSFNFAASTTQGSTSEPYAINFLSAFTQDLAAGNNWYSTYISIDGKTGLQLMETELGTSANNIKSQTKYTTFVSNGNWFGALTEANNREMYIINMTEAHSFSLPGQSVEPSEVLITTQQGWNWIGYPVEEELTIGAALSSLSLSNGDKIKSQSQQSEYGNGSWTGELTTMIPGQGYMYYQKAEGTQTLIYNPSKSGGKSLNDNVKDKDRHWNPDIHKYAMNMSVTATISVDCEIQNNENLEVGAFCNGEVRGSARPIFYEPLNEYVVMLTVHGEDDDNIVFKLYDSANGVEYKSLSKETLRYSDNGIFGSLSMPYTISFGSSNESSGINFYPNPTERGKDISLPSISEKVEIFNTIGVKIAEYQNVSLIKGIDAAGTYIIRVTDGASVRYGKLIVE